MTKARLGADVPFTPSGLTRAEILVYVPNSEQAQSGSPKGLKELLDFVQDAS